jgi:hypothetical protein
MTAEYWQGNLSTSMEMGVVTILLKQPVSPHLMRRRPHSSRLPCHSIFERRIVPQVESSCANWRSMFIHATFGRGRSQWQTLIVFINEADTLFGKRRNVRDVHHKYANQEVAYLLQRVEGYNGLVILATNLRRNIDKPSFAAKPAAPPGALPAPDTSRPH